MKWTDQIVKPTVYPTVSMSHPNGQIPTAEMVQVESRLGAAGYLVPPAARSYRALQAHLLKLGHHLTLTGANRPYALQEKLFLERHHPVKVWQPRAKRWRNQWWALNKGMATAAVPGTSNHGRGTTGDLALLATVTSWPPISLTRDAITDLELIAALYGWQWELKSEVWHLNHLTGDEVTDAVTRYEAGLTEPPPTSPPTVRKPIMPDPIRHPTRPTTVNGRIPFFRLQTSNPNSIEIVGLNGAATLPMTGADIATLGGVHVLRWRTPTPSPVNGWWYDHGAKALVVGCDNGETYAFPTAP